MHSASAYMENMCPNIDREIVDKHQMHAVPRAVQVCEIEHHVTLLYRLSVPIFVLQQLLV